MRDRIIPTNILTAAAVFVMAVVCSAQAEDPHGWTKAKWGMTEAEIKAAFPDAKIVNPGARLSFLAYDGLQIGVIHYHVQFSFDKDALIQVNLQPEGDRAVVSEVAQGALLTGLKDKYGAPQSHENPIASPAGQEHEWEWTFPESVIALTFAEHHERQYNFTTLVYRKRQKADAL